MSPNKVCEYPSEVTTKLKPLLSQAGELVGLLHAHLKSACLCYMAKLCTCAAQP